MRNLTYIVNDAGERLFVQLPVEEWDKLMSERDKLIAERKFRNGLRAALKDADRIHRGKKRGTTLKELLHEM